jgi:hypothetical protein
MQESKHDRFVRVAERRTNDVLERLRILSNCSSTGNYEYSQDQVAKIFAEIDRAIRSARGKFKGEKRRTFTL